CYHPPTRRIPKRMERRRAEPTGQGNPARARVNKKMDNYCGWGACADSEESVSENGHGAALHGCFRVAQLRGRFPAVHRQILSAPPCPSPSATQSADRHAGPEMSLRCHRPLTDLLRTRPLLPQTIQQPAHCAKRLIKHVWRWDG